MSRRSEGDRHKIRTDLARHQSVAVDVAVRTGHDVLLVMGHHLAFLMLMRTCLAQRCPGVWQHERNEQGEGGQSKHAEVYNIQRSQVHS